jgi:hypothetical protein
MNGTEAAIRPEAMIAIAPIRRLLAERFIVCCFLPFFCSAAPYCADSSSKGFG